MSLNFTDAVPYISNRAMQLQNQEQKLEEKLRHKPTQATTRELLETKSAIIALLDVLAMVTPSHAECHKARLGIEVRKKEFDLHRKQLDSSIPITLIEDEISKLISMAIAQYKEATQLNQRDIPAIVDQVIRDGSIALLSRILAAATRDAEWERRSTEGYQHLDRLKHELSQPIRPMSTT